MKVNPLDPPFGKLVALMRSSTHEGERSAARAKAETLAASHGGLDRALRVLAYEEARTKAPNNPFAGWDEHEEIDNPGHIARKAAQRAEKRRLWQERRAELIRQYGSLDAVLEPCERELAIRKAVKPWRVAQKRPHQRWTAELKGYDTLILVEKMPPDLRAAIEGAYPMPTTFDEARAELAYWRERDNDMAHALYEEDPGDCALDRVARTRMELVRELVEHEITLDTLPAIVERFRIYREREIDEPHIEAALFRDLEAMVVAQAVST